MRNFKQAKSIGEIIGIIVLVALALAAAFSVSAFLIMLAWGGIACIFGWITISYMQAISVALGVLILGGIFHGYTSNKK